MKRRVAVVVLVVVVVALAAVSLFLLTRPLRRRLALRIPRAKVPPVGRVEPGLHKLPQDRWTGRLLELEDAEDWAQLDLQLAALAELQPHNFSRYELRYLHARVKQELEEYDSAISLFQPCLEPDHRFRDLALYHLSEISDEKEEPDTAAGYRDELIFSHPGALYRSQAIEDQLSYFAEAGDLNRFAQFAGRLRPQADTALRRTIDAQWVELLAKRGAMAEAKERGIRLLRGEEGDDAAERVFRALDHPQVTRGFTAGELMVLGGTAQAHRHFERAVALLSAARAGLPRERDQLTFAIGRSFFGAEQYEQAERTYVQGAAESKDPEAQATFLYHASRCAQLTGDDAQAESLMTRAIAVPGRFDATSAALTQRMRTRAHQKRFGAAASDLGLLKKLFPNRHATVEASISLATSWIAAGRYGDALRDLAAIPRSARERYDLAEIDYWRARSLEKSNAPGALQAYLSVLRSAEPTHFAYLARQRLKEVFHDAASREVERLQGEVQAALSQKELDRARRLQTDVVLLAPNDRRELEKLRSLYQQLPRYQTVLDLKPRRFPSFPMPADAGRTELLLAMGLFDEGVDGISERYPLRPLDSALTASLAFNLAGASRSSLQAVEILVRNIPEDFVPELLPRLVRELLYPRYFYQHIEEDSETYEADPILVLAIMREESRFNPRAKSVAAARGLLQFILTTALQIGRDLGIADLSSEDLYDPRIVIQLGAKYIGDLLEQFNRNPYQTTAAYNAGPNQARLWARLAPAAGDDFYLSAINFEETKLYVRKVMNSYQRYREIYERAGVQGGIRAEP